MLYSLLNYRESVNTQERKIHDLWTKSQSKILCSEVKILCVTGPESLFAVEEG